MTSSEQTLQDRVQEPAKRRRGALPREVTIGDREHLAPQGRQGKTGKRGFNVVVLSPEPQVHHFDTYAALGACPASRREAFGVLSER